MARITVVGGTGYTGSALVRVAHARGHEVTAISRSLPAEAVDGVAYLALDVTDPAAATAAVSPQGEPADAVVSALAPRADMAGRVAAANALLADAAAEADTRLVVVGGFGSMRPADGAPRIAETPDFPDAFRAEALEMASTLDALAARTDDLSWLYVSPSAGYGAYNPLPATGAYRVAGSLVTPDGADVSANDFALAIVEELENATRSGHISVFA